ncbi:MAG: flippase [Planctomycetota bacterium]|nr:flippase [Planctomycetota bacterium]
MSEKSDRRKLVLNFLSLSFTRGFGYIFPLITVPYLVRVLGPVNFGGVAFVQALNVYFSFLVNYGFDLSATKEVAQNREDKEKVKEIYNSVRGARILLASIGFLIYFSIVWFIPQFRTDTPLFLGGFCIPLANSLVQTWFLLGIERMNFIPLLNSLGNIAYTAAVFLFIRESSHYVYALPLRALGYAVEGVGGMVVIRYRLGIHSLVPRWKGISRQLKEGWRLFLSVITSTSYRYSNTLILGFLAPMDVVGYYAAAEKMLHAAWMLVVLPVSQSVYPHVARLVKKSKRDALQFVRKLLFFFGGSTYLLSFSISLLAVPIVEIVLGSGYRESVVVVRTLAFLLFFIGMGDILGNQIMLPFNFVKAYSFIYVIANGVNITLSVFLVPYLRQFGASVAVVATEAFIPLAMYVYIRKKGIRIIKTILPENGSIPQQDRAELQEERK